MFAVFAFGQPYFADYPLAPVIPPVPPVLEIGPLGGRRVEWDEVLGKRRRKKREDEKPVYVPLDDHTIAELWPSRPMPETVTIVPAMTAAQVPIAVVPMPADELDPALIAAILTAIDEDF